VEGSEALHAVVREGMPDNPSEALKRANTNARALLEPTRAKIAQLTITVEVQNGVQPEVLIDGQAIPPALLGAARPTDRVSHAGAWTVIQQQDGATAIGPSGTLAPGQQDSLAPRLDRSGAAAANPAPPRTPGTTRAELEPKPPFNAGAEAAAASGGMGKLPAYVSWGVAAASLVVGAAFGWVAMDQKSDLETACPAMQCPPEQAERLDAARTNATISSLAFGVGAGAAVLGGVLFFLADDGEEARTARLTTDGVSVRLRF
jgi:hypothetical protein